MFSSKQGLELRLLYEYSHSTINKLDNETQAIACLKNINTVNLTSPEQVIYNIDQSKEYGFTPMHYAIKNQMLKLLLMLITKHSKAFDPNLRYTNRGKTEVEVAIENNCLTAIEIFINYRKIDHSIRDLETMQIPIVKSSRSRKWAICELLAKNLSSFDPSIINEASRVLLYSVYSNKENIFNILIKKFPIETLKNTKYHDGYYLLHCSIENTFKTTNTNILKTLLKLGFNPNQRKDQASPTAIEVAINGLHHQALAIIYTLAKDKINYKILNRNGLNFIEQSIIANTKTNNPNMLSKKLKVIQVIIQNDDFAKTTLSRINTSKYNLLDEFKTINQKNSLILNNIINILLQTGIDFPAAGNTNYLNHLLEYKKFQNNIFQILLKKDISHHSAINIVSFLYPNYIVDNSLLTPTTSDTNNSGNNLNKKSTKIHSNMKKNNNCLIM